MNWRKLPGGYGVQGGASRGILGMTETHALPNT